MLLLQNIKYSNISFCILFFVFFYVVVEKRVQIYFLYLFNFWKKEGNDAMQEFHVAWVRFKRSFIIPHNWLTVVISSRTRKEEMILELKKPHSLGQSGTQFCWVFSYVFCCFQANDKDAERRISIVGKGVFIVEIWMRFCWRKSNFDVFIDSFVIVQ